VFAIVVFRNLKIEKASFWEIGMSCSIFASAIVSMLIYSYLSGQLNKISIKQAFDKNSKNEYFEVILDSIHEGILVIKN
jgi:hypothetical protein